MLFSQQILELIRNGIGETLCMVVISTVISYMIGIPLGIILVVTDKEGIRPIPALQKVLGLIINLLRSVPFLILLIMMIPVTRKLVGTSLGWRAVVPPLVASAAPYIARMVESSFKEIDAGVIEAAKSMGASTFQIIWKVILPESLPSLVASFTTAFITILGYGAMAGAIGGGGLGKMFSKVFSGESMFQNIYTARGAGMIAFGSSFPGRILPLTIQPGQEVILQKAAFLAAETGVNLSVHFNKKMGTGFFGGEGFIMQRLSGSGMAFAEVDGELVEYTLGPGQQMVVDTGNVLGFEGGVSIDIQQVKGLKNKLLGGEGFFNTVLTGPGKIWLQTMPISGVAAALLPYIPTGNN